MSDPNRYRRDLGFDPVAQVDRDTAGVAGNGRSVLDGHWFVPIGSLAGHWHVMTCAMRGEELRVINLPHVCMKGSEI